MSTMGLLDLPAPLLQAVDGWLALLLPALLRVWLYGAISGVVSMALYRRWSAQSKLAALSERTRALRQELAGYDGPFDGLMTRVGELLRLSGRHLRLSFVPAMLSGLPVLFLLPWLSNHFGHQWPSTGDALQVQPQGLSVPVEALQWSGPDGATAVHWDPDSGSWALSWPAAEQPVELRQGELRLLTLPPAGDYAIPVLHKRSLPFNWLIANPAGYLPDDGPLQAVALDLPPQALHGLGPGWLRHWLAMYLLPLLAVSLWLRWRWRLQ